MIRALLFSLVVAIAAITSPISPTVQAAETRTVTLDIPGMTCDHCAKSAGEADPGQLLKAVESKAMAPACWTMRVKS